MEFLKLLPIIISLLGLLIAIGTLRINVQTSQSKDLLQEATLLLDRAYNALTDDGKSTAPVAPDRLNWLTSARHIEDYRKIKAMLKNTSHKLVCAAQEEHWRHKFYLLLKDYKLYPLSYFEKNLEKDKSEIEPVSAVVIFNFAFWPKDKKDPLDEVDYHELLKGRPTFLSYNFFFRQYLSKIKKMNVEL